MKNYLKFLCLGLPLSLCLSLLFFSFAFALRAQEISNAELDSWITNEYRHSFSFMLRNIHPTNTTPGIVVASPSRSAPNYFFHWVRDAALVMDTLHGVYLRIQDSEKRALIMNLFEDYVALSRRLQQSENRSGGLGEPKFNPDGSSFDGDWGRPQNDGPALRALSLIHYAKTLIATGRFDFVRENLYDGQSPSESVIKLDLDFVALRWRNPSVDLWEETRGDHFYTRMVQRRSLIEGAELAETLGDFRSADRYRLEAVALSKEIDQHWNAAAGLIIPTLNQSGGVVKAQGLDAAVMLGALHGEHGDGFFGVNDDRVLASVLRFKRRFQNFYVVNQKPTLVGIGLGRYPEDTYDGNRTDRLGNPWFLITIGYAEYLYKLEAVLRVAGRIRVTALNQTFFQDLVPGDSFEPGTTIDRTDERFGLIVDALRRAAEQQMQRVRSHSKQDDGSLSEQFNRNSGFMQGAEHLTWSYASFLTAFWARQTVLRMTGI